MRSDPITPAAIRKRQIKWFLQRLGTTSEAIAEALKRRGTTGMPSPGANPVTQLLRWKFGLGTRLVHDERLDVFIQDYATEWPATPGMARFYADFENGRYPALITKLPEGDAGLSC